MLNRLCCTDPLYHRIAKVRATASGKVQTAIKTGKIKKLDGSIECIDCKGVATSYDHRDYREPLIVEPVCVRCNKRRGNSVDILLMKAGKL